MSFGKDAWRLSAGVLVCCLGFGCFTPAINSEPSTGLAQANRAPQMRVAADLKPVPVLRIPGQPAAKPSADNSVVQVSASAGTSVHLATGSDVKDIPGEQNLDGNAKLQALYQDAAQRYASVDSYIVRLRRREQVNGQDKPEEVLLFKFRKQPWSVYLKWLGPEGIGRQVVYVKGQHEDKIHTLLAAGDMPFVPAGRQIALAPDNPLVRSSSRHSIHEAGFGVLIESFGRLLTTALPAVPGNPAPMLRYLGPLKRPEFEMPGDAVEQTIPPGLEPQLPQGGRRLWVFDPHTKFPLLIVTHNELGHEVEYYCYDRLQFPVRLDDADFNPEKLWTAKKPESAKKP
jgi:hypothetical protein